MINATICGVCHEAFKDANTNGRLTVPPLPRGAADGRQSGLVETLRPAAAAVGLDHCWITTVGGRTAGVVVLGRVAANVAKLVLFRVDPEWHHTAIASGLIRQLYRHCRQQGYRTIVVEEGAMPGWAFRTIEQYGFLFSRRLRCDGKQHWEFRLGGAPLSGHRPQVGRERAG